MNADCHYYAVLALCRMLGMGKDSARRIAYSSEFVDDLRVKHIVFRKAPRRMKCHILGKKPALKDLCTAPKIMTARNYKVRTMVEVLVPFHLIPAGRGKSFQEKMRTFPDSPLLAPLVDDAVNSGDVYQLGIVLHVLADAYSHQGFSGIISRRNRIRGLKVKKASVRGFHDRFIRAYLMYADSIITRLFGRILPAYSHSAAGTIPDIASAEWEYKYDTGESFITRYRSGGAVSNPRRYRQAFEAMRGILQEFIQKHPAVLHGDPGFQDFELFYSHLTKPRKFRKGAEDWKDFILEYRLMDSTDPGIHYDPQDWFRDAFLNYSKRKFSRRVVSRADAVPDFVHSDLYAFYNAAGKYKEHYKRLAVLYGLF